MVRLWYNELHHSDGRHEMTKYEARMMLAIAGSITVIWCLTWVLATLFHVAGVDGG